MYQRQLTFQEAIRKVFVANYCNFIGRASRSEFWWFQLFCFVVNFIVSILTFNTELGVSILGSVVSLIFILPNLGLIWRRLHDIGKGGGWFFICLIPVIGIIVLIVWFCQESEKGANRFGPEPNLVA